MSDIVWGMPSLIELSDCEENVRLCAGLELSFVELNMNLPMFQAEHLPGLAALSDRYGKGFTIHLDENFKPADFNPLVAEAHLNTLLETIRAAKLLGAPVINMHMDRGVYFKLPDRKVFLFEHYREQYLGRMRRMCALCEDAVGGSGITICLENTNGFLPFQQEAVDLLLESSLFALTWDVGHSMNCTDGLNDEAFIRARTDRLAHFHIHDAIGEKSHLSLGDGAVDISDRLILAQSRGARCVLETKTVQALRQSAKWLRERGWL